MYVQYLLQKMHSEAAQLLAARVNAIVMLCFS